MSDTIKLLLTSNLGRILASLIVLMIALGCWRVVDTYQFFWQTWDEPAHIATGMQWLDRGEYTYNRLHPPLAGAMIALGPYLAGARTPDKPMRWWDEEGNAILDTGGQYERNLALARSGILPFFVIASMIVALWAKTLGGTTASLLSTLLFTTLPPILAHAGNATLDMACTAFVAAALFSLTIWFRRPSAFNSVVLGATVGLAVLSKFSALFFLLAAGCLIVIVWGIRAWRNRATESGASWAAKRWMTASASALVVCALVIWAGYRFSVGTLADPETRPHRLVDRIVGAEGTLHDVSYYLLENTPYPAPEFLQGIRGTIDRNSDGHVAYLLGDMGTTGWWYFYPIVLAVKTPLPFAFLCVTGVFYILRSVWRKESEWFQLSVPVIAFAGILAVGMASHVQNGLRQVLSVYPLLAIVAGYGAANLLKSERRYRLVGLGLVVVLFLWHLLSSVAAHPDYLPYFNELAGSHPEEIVVDSDLDWAQDLKRLARTLEDRGIEELAIKIGGTANLDSDVFDLPPRRTLQPYQRETGWIAIDVFHLTLGTLEAPHDQFAWLREYEPVERVGKSIWLYYIPEDQQRGLMPRIVQYHSARVLSSTDARPGSRGGCHAIASDCH